MPSNQIAHQENLANTVDLIDRLDEKYRAQLGFDLPAFVGVYREQLLSRQYDVIVIFDTNLLANAVSEFVQRITLDISNAERLHVRIYSDEEVKDMRFPTGQPMILFLSDELEQEPDNVLGAISAVGMKSSNVFVVRVRSEAAEAPNSDLFQSRIWASINAYTTYASISRKTIERATSTASEEYHELLEQLTLFLFAAFDRQTIRQAIFASLALIDRQIEQLQIHCQILKNESVEERNIAQNEIERLSKIYEANWKPQSSGRNKLMAEVNIVANRAVRYFRDTLNSDGAIARELHKRIDDLSTKEELNDINNTIADDFVLLVNDKWELTQRQAKQTILKEIIGRLVDANSETLQGFSSEANEAKDILNDLLATLPETPDDFEDDMWRLIKSGRMDSLTSGGLSADILRLIGFSAANWFLFPISMAGFAIGVISGTNQQLEKSKSDLKKWLVNDALGYARRYFLEIPESLDRNSLVEEYAMEFQSVFKEIIDTIAKEQMLRTEALFSERANNHSLGQKERKTRLERSQSLLDEWLGLRNEFTKHFELVRELSGDGVDNMNEETSRESNHVQVREALESSLFDVATLIGERSDVEIPLRLSGSIAPGLDRTVYASQVNALGLDIQRGIFRMIVLGEFNNGKSTLINALMGGEMMRMKAIPTTAIIAEVVHSDRDQVQVFFKGQDEPAETLSYEEFGEKYQLTAEDMQRIKQGEMLDRFEHVDYALFESVHPFLPNNNVRLVDSPGLQERRSRTRLSLDWLAKSQAVVYVFRDVQVLNEYERELINSFGDGPLNHVFFVINYQSPIDEKDHADIDEFLRTFLEPKFTDRDGKLQADLYNRRVFYVDAKKALKLHQDSAMYGAVEFEQRLAVTGITEFRAELSAFLRGHERFQAVVQSSREVLVYPLADAFGIIKNNKHTMQRNQDDLERDYKVTAAKLVELASTKTKVTEIIDNNIAIICDDLYQNLTAYIGQMERDWEEKADEHFDFNEITNVFKTIGAMWRNNFNRQKIVAENESKLKPMVEAYFEANFTTWQKEATAKIEPRIGLMNQQIGAAAEEFDLELLRIRNLFAGYSEGTSAALPSMGTQGAIFAIGGLFIGDPSMILYGTLGDGSFQGLGKVITQQVVNWTITFIVTGLLGNAFGVVVFLLGEAIHGLGMLGERERKAKEFVGEKLFENLYDGLPSIRDQLSITLNNEFAPKKAAIIGSIDQQIADESTRQTKVLTAVSQGELSTTAENKRLNAIHDLLLNRFNVVSHMIDDQVFSEEDIVLASQAKSILNLDS